MKYLLRLLPYLKHYKLLVAFSLLLTTCTIVVGLALPWPLQVLIDNVLGEKPLSPMFARLVGGLAENRTSLLVTAILAGFGLALIHEAFLVISKFVNTKLEQRIILDLRTDLFSHAQRLPMSFHDRRRSGSLIYTVNYQASAGARLLMTVPPMIHSVLMLVGMFVILIRINLQLGLVSLAVVPLLYYYITYYATHIQDRLRDVKTMEGETISIIHEGISMIRVITAFGREPFEVLRFRRQGTRAAAARVNLTLRETLFNMAVNATTAGGTALVLGVGAYQAMQGKISAGELLVAISYLSAVYKPLTTISYTMGSLQDMLVSLQMAFNLLDTDPEIKDSPGAIRVRRAAGHVTFDQVDFSYNNRMNTLTGISFEAAPGMVVGIVGPTGAGKSTLVSLIPRFYEPTSGAILIDGRETRNITLRSLREQVSIVLQDPLLFSGTVADNIRYGRLEANDSEVEAAARAANAHDFIMRLPDKYKTGIGERGVRLSGGERQRICIARAFLKDAPILILDEPTSSVDSRTEAEILEALDRLVAGRTTFMIAHRLSTIRRADLILVLDEGRIVEQGEHSELANLGGLYTALYEMQTGSAPRPSHAVEGAKVENSNCPKCGGTLASSGESRDGARPSCPACTEKAEGGVWALTGRSKNSPRGAEGANYGP